MDRRTVGLIASGGLVVAGVALAVLVPLHPSILGGADVADVVRTTGAWRAIHLAMYLGAPAAFAGVVGIPVDHDLRLGPYGWLGVALVAVGSVAVAAVGFFEAFAFPVLATEDPDLLTLDGPILGSVLFRAASAPAAGFPIGLGLLGWAARREDRHRAPGTALAVAAAAFSVGEGAFIPVVGVVSSVFLGAVLVWWAALVWAGRDRDGVLAPPAPGGRLAGAGARAGVEWRDEAELLGGQN